MKKKVLLFTLLVGTVFLTEGKALQAPGQLPGEESFPNLLTPEEVGELMKRINNEGVLENPGPGVPR